MGELIEVDFSNGNERDEQDSAHPFESSSELTETPERKNIRQLLAEAGPKVAAIAECLEKMEVIIPDAKMEALRRTLIDQPDHEVLEVLIGSTERDWQSQPGVFAALAEKFGTIQSKIDAEPENRMPFTDDAQEGTEGTQ